MKMPLSSVCYGGSKRGERMREDFEVVAAALQKKYPGLYDVHGFLVENGLRDALVGNTPTRTRGAMQILDPTVWTSAGCGSPSCGLLGKKRGRSKRGS